MLREPPPPLNHLQLLTLPSLHHVNEMVHPVASWLRGSANHHRFHAAVSGWITSAELDGHVTSKIQKTSETSEESIWCHPSPQSTVLQTSLFLSPRLDTKGVSDDGPHHDVGLLGERGAFGVGPDSFEASWHES